MGCCDLNAEISAGQASLLCKQVREGLSGPAIGLFQDMVERVCCRYEWGRERRREQQRTEQASGPREIKKGDSQEARDQEGT